MTDEETKFGTYYEGDMKYCKRCNHIIGFPITSNLYAKTSEIGRLKRFNFRVVERESWREKTNRRPCGGTYDKVWEESVREDKDSCMNCWNRRGTDCDESWKEDSCQVHHCYFITPFTICDLHQIDLRRVRILFDGTIEGIPEHCYKDTWMSLEKVKEFNVEWGIAIRKDNEKRSLERKARAMRDKDGSL